MLDCSSSTKWILGGALGLSKNESSASFQGFASSSLAFGTFKPQCDLLGLLSLLPEDRLGLTSESLLLGFVSPIADGPLGFLTGLVLRNLVNFVCLACLTVRVLKFGTVHLQKSMCQMLHSHNGASAPTPLRVRHETYHFPYFINKY